jgi:hypothetical protein
MNVPLRGDFTVSFDAPAPNAGQISMVYAGIRSTVQFDRKNCVVTAFGRPHRTVPIDPPLAEATGLHHCRIEVKGQTYTFYEQDRKIVEEPIAPGADPWLAIHQIAEGRTGIRNLKLDGTPVVPGPLELTALPDLSGWLADYYTESVDGDHPAWTRKGDELIGANIGSNARPSTDRYGNAEQGFYDRTARIGSNQESLLQYHRPMLEDGTISYEFYYEPGKAAVHPTLDRLSLLLEEDGVQVHWLTDAQPHRSGT